MRFATSCARADGMSWTAPTAASCRRSRPRPARTRRLRRQGTLKEFDSSPGPDVDAIEGYCLAFRRADALAAGGFDTRFRFYRMADVEFSFRLRAGGGRAVALAGLPLVKHEHRLWESTEPSERERLSKRNMYRFLDRWRDREDLLVGQ